MYRTWHLFDMNPVRKYIRAADLEVMCNVLTRIIHSPYITKLKLVLTLAISTFSLNIVTSKTLLVLRGIGVSNVAAL